MSNLAVQRPFSEESTAILKQYASGNCEADECFCLVLSIEGYDKCRNYFLSSIDALKRTHLCLHKQLMDIYKEYFSDVLHSQSSEAVGCCVENGYLTSDFGYELDMELAMSLSISESKHNESPHMSTDINKPQSCSGDSYGHLSNYTTDDSNSISETKRTKIKNETVNQHLQAPPGLQLIESKNKRHKKKKKKGTYSLSKHLSNKPVIYWMRRDLRMYDNPALLAAVSCDAPVVIVFIWSSNEEDPFDVLASGGATKLWLHYALKSLSQTFVNNYGNSILYYKSNDSLQTLKQIVQHTGASSLYLNNVYEPFLNKRDDDVCKQLSKAGIQCNRFDSYLLHEPSSVNTETLGMRGVGSVTHFMECCRQSSAHPIGHPVESPTQIPRCSNLPSSEGLDDLQLAKMPKRKNGTVIDWAAPIVKAWNFSEDGAWEALGLFLTEGIKKYEKESCRADNVNTCRISPYLHFGQISPRAILTEAKHMKSPKFLRKLAWRDLSYWLLTLWTDLPSQPVRPQYRHQRWSSNTSHLEAWQKGNTGYPLVDAAMRQLWLTGWMNNYMRHVVASFLISYLHLHWIEGYRWFQDTLLDADVAINAMMWQNGGMSGLDQWNFVMHPVDAAMTCDPEGTYVRQWCPELARVPNDFVHQPWKCPPSIIKRCNVEIGVNYPHRIITNLEVAREQSLKDVVEIRKKFTEFVDPHTGNDLVPVRNGRLLIPVITRKEFKYKTAHPDAKDNPHTAVLRGYRSRKRDEAIAFANQRDFLASTMNECVQRQERHQKALTKATF